MQYSTAVEDSNPVVWIIGNTVLMDGVEACLRELKMDNLVRWNLISAEFEKPVTVEEARAVLSRAPGLDVIDDPEHKKYPVPLDIAGRDNCAVGRIRLDCALENGLAFWVVGDQLLKGAALNAVQIAECL